MKTKLIIVCIAVLSAGCLKQDPYNKPFHSFTPRVLQDCTLVGTPTVLNIDSLALHRIYEDVHADSRLWSIRSLLVFRKDSLLAEHYFKDEGDLKTPHLIWSCTKQVMGALTGIALHHGILDSINDPIGNYLPQLNTAHPDKSTITIQNLLMMQSGIAFENDGVGGQTDKLLRQKPENSVEFILDLPTNQPPGTSFHYNDGDPHLLSAIIQQRTGLTTWLWADQVLFKPLHITNYEWDVYKDGVTFGGFGLITTPRELAKFALCIKNQGAYQGQDVVPKAWVNDMLTAKTTTDIDFDFGFMWWTDQQRNIQFMWGHGGQFAFIIPQKDLVVVVTAIPNTQGQYQILADDMLPYIDRLINIAQ